MNKFKYLLIALVAGICFAVTAPKADAQVSIGVSIGAAPDCPYGYYDYSPYGCAPYGYYGPEWFTGGVFIGAGPWFHGPDNFHGHVNNHYDPSHGYKGAAPHPGDKSDPKKPAGNPSHFKANETHDSKGHATPGKH
jgi:hypothetical protein